MTSASLRSVSLIKSCTHASIVPMLPAWTPQSMRMCCGPAFVGTVRRKKSPKPIRYMRTRRTPPALLLPAGRRRPLAAPDLPAFALPARPADVALLAAFFALFLADLPALFLADFLALFLVVFLVTIIRTPDEAVRN